MAGKRLKRVIRTRKLTPAEAARDREIRRQVQAEFPPRERPMASESLSAALKEAIRQSTKTPYQIAREAGVSQIIISRFLSGERDIRMATADKIATVLGLTLVPS